MAGGRHRAEHADNCVMCRERARWRGKAVSRAMGERGGRWEVRDRRLRRVRVSRAVSKRGAGWGVPPRSVT
jgi:hypothetical protein